MVLFKTIKKRTATTAMSEPINAYSMSGAADSSFKNSITKFNGSEVVGILFSISNIFVALLTDVDAFSYN